MADIGMVLHLPGSRVTGGVPATPRVKRNDIGLLADAVTCNRIDATTYQVIHKPPLKRNINNITFTN